MNSPGAKTVSMCGVLAGQGVEILDRNGARFASRRDRLDRGVQHPHRHRHVRRMGRAIQASDVPITARLRVKPPIAEQPAPGSRLLQGLGRVVKIGAAHPVQQPAPAVVALFQSWPRGSAGTPAESTRHSRDVRAYRLPGGVFRAGAHRSSVRRRHTSIVSSPRPVHIDKMRGHFDLQLHQVQQIGAARNEFRVGVFRKPMLRRPRLGSTPRS